LAWTYHLDGFQGWQLVGFGMDKINDKIITFLNPAAIETTRYTAALEYFRATFCF
jgi:hypothetical protein